jgi:hypothetical protein
MATFDLFTGAAHMRDATEELLLAWQQTTEHWNDSVSQKFCQQYLEPLGPSMKLSLDSIGQIGQSIQQMQRECES